ncbi:MAG TPA: PDZ domain-containing protein [Allosphingosinicella sp.]|nr:PDZ domain-containing protein [Allosphingosinicella sp.]
MQLSARDRRALTGGGLVIAVLLAYLLLWRGEPAPPPVQAPATQAVTSTAPPVPVPQAPPVPPPADASQLRLYGVMGGGAVIGLADGSQRYVPLGREVLPGLTLKRLEVHHAVLDSGGTEIRLGFDGIAEAQATAAPPPGQAAQAPAGEASLRQETQRYRLGLVARRQNGRVTGFIVRPGAELPTLARAGIQPGDVILSVNGSTLNEEQMLELAWTIANSNRTEFEVERGGRRVRLSTSGQ